MIGSVGRSTPLVPQFTNPQPRVAREDDNNPLDFGFDLAKGGVVGGGIGVLGGVAAGAGIGTVLGPLGAGVGAVVGALVGGGIGALIGAGIEEHKDTH